MTEELLAMIKDVKPSSDEEIAKLARRADGVRAVFTDDDILSLIARIVAERKVAITECKAAVELYATSYSIMAKIEDGRVSASDVAYDMRANIIGRNLLALEERGS